MTIIRRSGYNAKRARKSMDFRRLDRMTDADIERAVASDPDAAPILTPESMKRLRRRHPPGRLDVRRIRLNQRMTQEAFAAHFGFSLGSLRNWEQGHRQPTGAARILLAVIDRAPKAVEAALRPGKKAA